MLFFKSCLTVLCFVLIANTLFAQTSLSEGYYIGTTKDTVRGFFNFDNLMHRKVLFYIEKTGAKSKKLTPEDILEIETLDKISIRTFNYTGGDQAELIFITRYADGNVSLYEGQSLNPQERNVLCISSTKIPLIRKISAANTKAYLNTYFKGCEVGNNFSIKYDKLSVLAGVSEYSKCAYPDAKIAQKLGKSSKISVEIGVQSAIFMNKGVYKGFYSIFSEDDTESKIAALFGGVVAFGLSNRLKIYTGVNYFQRQFTPIPNRYTASTSLPALLFALKANYIEVPLSVHYEFRKKNPAYIPKVFVGASKLIITKGEVTLSNYPSSLLYERKIFDFSFFGGVGVKKAFKNKSSIELNARVAFDTEDVTTSLRLDTYRYQLSLAYLFPFYNK
jgi:hypothetical protein